jgi:transcriptional regulator with XRE-family HTH domain
MTDTSYINITATSDPALLEQLGAFIKHQRLLQNKTQEQLAKEAGIVRSTLSLFERGENVSLLVFIQLLRALKLLPLLQEFQIRQQISPLQLAKMEQSKKVRARQTKTGKEKPGPENDW